MEPRNGRLQGSGPVQKKDKKKHISGLGSIDRATA
jgi:hypothetical protein